MLDTFEILTTTGVVLWSKSYAPVNPSVINSLINDVFIEERTLSGAAVGEDISAANNPPYKHDQHTLKWTTVKELGLIFVVGLIWSPYFNSNLLSRLGSQAVYRSLLHLSWVDKLVDNIKTIFIDLYGDQLKKPHTTIVECHFDEYFDQQMQQLEKTGLGTDLRFPDSPFQHQESRFVGISRVEPPPLPELGGKSNYIVALIFTNCS